MSAERLLSQLEGVKRSGADRWLAKCPAHEDRTASLSVRELEDGRVLLHDFAGCPVEEVLAAVGLTFDSLYPERPIDHRRPRDRKPYSARDLVRALSFELQVATVLLIDIAAGRPLAEEDRERAGTATRRIDKFLRELQHAG